ncbi:COG1470 family protein [Salinadaptatus halalkaliphilus]|uniref:COG1470 family protein n=1 Tax=Salinadaptatus halalkaliphilus TaxID=2419781 RepID=UPI001FE24A24|nr:hypothetical protein [Salinadaptatus halalkaliphilus]
MDDTVEIEEGTSYTVTLTDDENNPVEGVTVEYTGDDPEELTVESDGEGPAESDEAGQVVFDAEATQEGDYSLSFQEQRTDEETTADLFVRSAEGDNALITGEITDRERTAIDSETAESLQVTITEVDTGEEFVNSQALADFHELDENEYVDSAGFSPGEPDTYNIELAVLDADGSQYEFSVNDPEEEFRSFDGVTETVNVDQNDDLNFRLERIEDADRLTVLDDGERDTVEDAEDYPVETDRLESETVDADETVDLDVFVESKEFGEDNDVLEPYALQTGEVESTVADVDGTEDGADLADANVDLDPDTNLDTDENGLSTVDVSLTGVDYDDLDGNVDVDLHFNASSNVSEANDEVTITFVPDVGDTGTLSGEVDVINEDILVGVEDTQSNIYAESGIPVHAVQQDVVDDSTVTVTTDGTEFEELDQDDLTLEGIEDYDAHPEELAISPAPDAIAGDETGTGDVDLTEGNQVRVVTYDETGEVIVQDPRSDYLTTTDADSDLELVQNETDRSLEVHDDGADEDGDFQLHFLADGEYQVQQKVELTNTTSDESVTAWKNMTVDEDPSASQDIQTNTEDVFTDQQDLRFNAIDEQYDDDRAIPTDYTNDQGDFELLNLPVDVTESEEYVVIAGPGGDTGDAETDYGFANFAGYDTVDVHANAQTGQLNTDLSVQEFEPDREVIYDLDVTVADEEKYTEIPFEGETEVQVTAQQRLAGEDEDAFDDATGVDLVLDRVDMGTNVDELGTLADTTVTTNDDGVATTTFEAVVQQEGDPGELNISAALEEETAEGENFATEDEEEAQIEVFGAGEITGDVVDESGDNFGGIDRATVELYDRDIGYDEEDRLQEVETGPEGSFTFTEVETGNDYRVIAEFDGETGYTDVDDLSGGTTNADVVITGIEAPEGFDVVELDDVTATQGETVDVTASVANTGADDDEQEVTLTIEGTEIELTEEVEIDAGEQEDVTFEGIETGALEGDYTLTVTPEMGEEMSATLTVEEQAESNFAITEVDPAEDIEAGFFEQVEIDVTVENDGDEPDTQDVEFVFAGDVADSEELELEAGESETVTLSTTVTQEGDWHVQTLDDESETYQITFNGDAEDAGIAVTDNPVTDTTGDGLANDVRGDGSFSILDVQTLFDNLDNDEVQENAEVFNFSGIDDDEVSILDVQALFDQLSE